VKDDKVEDDDVEKEEDDDVEEGKVEEDDDKDDNVAEEEVEDHDVAEDEVEDGDAEDDDVKKEEDSMLILRRRKRMMLRKKTDPKTGTHTLCELVRSKCMPTCHKSRQKSHLIRKFTGKMLRRRLSPERRHTLRASLRNAHINIFQGTSEDPPYTEIYRKNAAA
jgi:cobalamin biosynthesis protein CobT